MKTCSKCNQDKSESEFAKRYDALQPYCKECNRKRLRSYYKKNKPKYKVETKKSYTRKKKWWQDYKATLKCSRCPENHPWCIEFHHPDPTQKDFDVSRNLYTYGRKTLMTEIAKCIVLCSNCHRKEHYSRSLLTA